jgi:hypothetical protein
MATLSVASEKIILTKEELKHIIEIAVRDALRSYQEVAEDVWQWPDPATLSVDTPVSNMKGDDEFLPVFEDPDEAALEEIKLPSNCASLEMWGTAIVMAGQNLPVHSGSKGARESQKKRQKCPTREKGGSNIGHYLLQCAHL